MYGLVHACLNLMDLGQPIAVEARFPVSTIKVMLKNVASLLRQPLNETGRIWCLELT